MFDVQTSLHTCDWQMLWQPVVWEWRCRRGNKHLHDYGIWIYNDVIAAYGSCCRAVTTSSRLWFDLVWPGNLKLFVCDGSFRLVMDLTPTALPWSRLPETTARRASRLTSHLRRKMNSISSGPFTLKINLTWAFRRVYVPLNLYLPLTEPLHVKPRSLHPLIRERDVESECTLFPENTRHPKPRQTSCKAFWICSCLINTFPRLNTWGWTCNGYNPDASSASPSVHLIKFL